MPTPSRPHVLTLHLSAAERRRLQALAARDGLDEEEAARRAIALVAPEASEAGAPEAEAPEAEAPEAEAPEAEAPEASGEARPSLADLMGDAIGSFDGPADLSTNKIYMEGYGE